MTGEPAKNPTSNVDRVYDRLRQMAANFEFKPDERINESQLSQGLGASRTPLREALNRLVAEGFLTFRSGRGFFCRSLTPALVMELYEARTAVECEAARLASTRSTDGELLSLERHLDRTEPEYVTCGDPRSLLEMDEDFHLRIARLSRNGELLRMLENLNDRVRYLRLVYMRRLTGKTPMAEPEAERLSAHRSILNALVLRDPDQAALAMRRHIERRQDDAVEAVRAAYSQLYVPEDVAAAQEPILT